MRKKLFDSGPPAVARKAQVCARDENDGQGDRQRDVVRRQQSPASPYEKCLRLEPFVPVACERKVQAKAAQDEKEADAGGSAPKKEIQARDQTHVRTAEGVDVEQHHPESCQCPKAVNPLQPARVSGGHWSSGEDCGRGRAHGVHGRIKERNAPPESLRLRSAHRPPRLGSVICSAIPSTPSNGWKGHRARC